MLKEVSPEAGTPRVIQGNKVLQEIGAGTQGWYFLFIGSSNWLEYV